MSGAKRGPTVDDDAVAQALVTAILRGDEEAAKKHDLSVRTIERYRARMRVDDTLAELVIAKKAAVDAEYAGEMRDTIRAINKALKTSAETADVKDPEVIHALSGALKILSETDMTSKVIDARLAQTHRERGAGNREVDANAEEGSGDPRAPTIH